MLQVTAAVPNPFDDMSDADTIAHLEATIAKGLRVLDAAERSQPLAMEAVVMVDDDEPELQNSAVPIPEGNEPSDESNEPKYLKTQALTTSRSRGSKGCAPRA